MKGFKFFNAIFCAILFTSFLGCYSGDKTLIPKPPYVPTEIEESYVLKFEPKVDIVFIIDDSGSMYTHQRNLSTNMGLFTAAMEKNKFLDYHIGVMSTSTSDGWYSYGTPGQLQGTPQYVSRDTNLGLRLLQQNIEALGTSGSATEKIYDPLFLGLSKNREKINPGFLRTEAFLVVIVVTDAEDQSKEASAFKVYNELVRLKSADDKKILGYAVLAYPRFFGDSCSQDAWDDPATITKFMSYFTNAKDSRVSSGLPTTVTPLATSSGLTNVFSLCDMQYGQRLANIGEDIRIRVSQRIPLPKIPVRGTIKLKYGSQYVDPKWWKYDPTSQSLILDPDIELVEEDDAQFSVVMDQSNPNDTIGAPTDVDPPFVVE